MVPGYLGYPGGVTKILVSFDDNLLVQVARAARAARLSRSAYLARLVTRELDSARGPGQRRRARRALARLDRLFARHPVGEDSTSAIRAERDAR